MLDRRTVLRHIATLMVVSRRKAQIVRLDQLSPTVRGLSLEVEEGPLGFEAGQWINVETTTDKGSEKRAYSIANSPSARLMELAVTLVPEGALSPILHRVEVGHSVTLDGPHGFFTRSGALSVEPALMVATGTGLAPFRSMLQDLPQRDPSAAPITLLFGCRSEADILWRTELEAMAQHGLFRLEISLSRPGPGWRGRRGYVQEHVPELATALGKPHVFICGLNRMVSEVRNVCKGDLGYPRTSIHSERYD